MEDGHLALFLLCLDDLSLYYGVIVFDGAVHGGEGGGYLSWWWVRGMVSGAGDTDLGGMRSCRHF